MWTNYVAKLILSHVASIPRLLPEHSQLHLIDLGLLACDSASAHFLDLGILYRDFLAHQDRACMAGNNRAQELNIADQNILPNEKNTRLELR